ncbi:ANM_HP_G0096100.mRNA.1.CDS.1 [Saccharomyces cerevisiae]|nr:ANM_HP_G0096100.mRNA.1.CDS.1 [Saccharomyces cerevisiae]CAI6382493.1 ANM_HP_G0096100.mRNA.1.CDS.1 [Saccharomyces cerevisiae]
MYSSVLSVDPKNYPDAPLEGIRRLVEIFLKSREIPQGYPLDVSRVSSIRMGTTLATNCALERNGGLRPCYNERFQRRMVMVTKLRLIFSICTLRNLGLYMMWWWRVDERVTLGRFYRGSQSSISNPVPAQNCLWK